MTTSRRQSRTTAVGGCQIADGLFHGHILDAWRGKVRRSFLTDVPVKLKREGPRASSLVRSRQETQDDERVHFACGRCQEEEPIIAQLLAAPTYPIW